MSRRHARTSPRRVARARRFYPPTRSENSNALGRNGTFPRRPQKTRGIHFCVERNREEVPVGGTTRHRAELARRLLKILRQSWAIVGNRTAREEERDRQRLTSEVVQAYSLPQFIRKLEDQQWV